MGREDWKYRFFYPAGVRNEHERFVKFFGKLGFVAKGVVYGILGGLVCATALEQPLPEGTEDNDSPQGVFLFLGGAQVVGLPLLVIMAMGLICYSTWRLWEAVTGQGSDKDFSRAKNVFKFRVSPMVSGCVYLAYLSYIIQTIVKLHVSHESGSKAGTSDNCFPNCWNTSDGGRAFIILVGLAFLIATITQLIPALTGSFYKDLKTHRYSRPARLSIHALGHIGFLGRAGVFLLVAVLMFKASHDDIDTEKYTVGAALNQLRENRASKTVMFILGLLLIGFGLFAVGNAWWKYFPSRPPSSGEAPRTRASDNDIESAKIDDAFSLSPKP